MTTINAVIIPNQEKKDGTWNVKIRMNKDRRPTYITRPSFRKCETDLKKEPDKNPKLPPILGPLLTEYRLEIGELGTKLSSFTSSKLAVNVRLFQTQVINRHYINYVYFE